MGERRMAGDRPPSSLQRQVSDGFPEARAAGRLGAPVLQLVCLGGSHGHVALGAWRDTDARRLRACGAWTAVGQRACGPTLATRVGQGQQTTWATETSSARPLGEGHTAGRPRPAGWRTRQTPTSGLSCASQQLTQPKGAGTWARGAPTWQLPWVAEDGNCNEEGSGPGAQEAHPPGTNPQRALGGQLGPVGKGRGVSIQGT